MAATGENLVVTATGARQGRATATRMPSMAARFVTIMAENANTGNVYIGLAGVTATPSTDDLTTGIQLDAGQSIRLPLDNDLDELYYICDNTTDDFTFLVESHALI